MTARTIRVDVVRIPTKGPGDVSGLIRLIETGRIDRRVDPGDPRKTEGNGGVNDFTREYAVSSLSLALAPYIALSPPRGGADRLRHVRRHGRRA